MKILESAENYLMEDGQFDYTVSAFELQDGVINAEIQQLASEICKAVNNTVNRAHKRISCLCKTAFNFIEKAHLYLLFSRFNCFSSSVTLSSRSFETPFSCIVTP